jgi:hypothetical protein
MESGKDATKAVSRAEVSRDKASAFLVVAATALLVILLGWVSAKLVPNGQALEASDIPEDETPNDRAAAQGEETEAEALVPDGQALEASDIPEDETPNDRAAAQGEETEPEAAPQTRTPVWLKAYISVLYVGLGPFLACAFGGLFYFNSTVILWGLGLALALLAAVIPISNKRSRDLLGRVTPDLWVAIVALLLVPIGFLSVPILERTEPDLKWPNLAFNAAALLVGGVALFMGIKDPKQTKTAV